MISVTERGCGAEAWKENMSLQIGHGVSRTSERGRWAGDKDRRRYGGFDGGGIGFVWRGSKWFRLLGFGTGIGFVRRVGTEFAAEGFEAVEFLDGPAI